MSDSIVIEKSDAELTVSQVVNQPEDQGVLDSSRREVEQFADDAQQVSARKSDHDVATTAAPSQNNNDGAQNAAPADAQEVRAAPSLDNEQQQQQQQQQQNAESPQAVAAPSNEQIEAPAKQDSPREQTGDAVPAAEDNTDQKSAGKETVPAQGSAEKAASAATEASQNATLDPVMLADKRIEKARQLKDDARPFITNKEYTAAIELYYNALNLLHPQLFQRCPKNVIEEFVALTNILLGNLAFCHYHLKSYDTAVKLVDRALETDPTNIKLLYRKAVSYKQLGDYERALVAIKDAYAIARQKQIQNQDVENEYHEIAKLYRAYIDQNKDRERLMYSRMMNNSPAKEQSQDASQASPAKRADDANPERLRASSSSFQGNNSSSVLLENSFLNSQHPQYWYYALSAAIGFGVPYALRVRMNTFHGVMGCTALSAAAYGAIKIRQMTWKSVFFALGAAITYIIYKFSDKTSKALANGPSKVK